MADQLGFPDEDSTQIESEKEERTQSGDTDEDASLYIHLYDDYKNESLPIDDRHDALFRLIDGIPPDNLDQSFDLIQDFYNEDNEDCRDDLTLIIQSSATRRSEWRELQEAIEKWSKSEDGRDKQIAIELTKASQPNDKLVNSPITVPLTIYSLLDQYVVDSLAEDPISVASINTLECLMLRGDQKIIDKLTNILRILIKVAEERYESKKPGEVFCATMNLLSSLVCNTEQLDGLIEEYLNVLFSISIKICHRSFMCDRHIGYLNPEYSAEQIFLKVCNSHKQKLDIELIDAKFPSILDEMSSWSYLREEDCYFTDGIYKEQRHFAGYTALSKYIEPIISLLCYAKRESRIVEVASRLLENEEWKKRSVALMALEFSTWVYDDIPKIVGIATGSLLDKNPMVRYCARQLFGSMMRRLGQDAIDERTVERMVASAMKNLVKELIDRRKTLMNGEEGGNERREEGAMWEELSSTLRQIAINCETSVTTDDYDATIRAIQSYLTQHSMHDQILRVLIAASISLIGFVHKEKWTRDFPQIFTLLASFNRTSDESRNESIDLCFSCQERMADVVLRKNCQSEEVREKSGCKECVCRPYWCLPCLARIFLAKGANLLGTCPCPFCAQPFCILDVIRTGAAESTKEE